MKPAEQSARHRREADGGACRRPGCRRAWSNYLPGVGEEIGPTLVDAPGRGADRVHRLAEGRRCSINEQAAKTPGGQDHVKRVIAEMGGKNAIIVDDDADLDEAVQGVVDARSATGAEVLGRLAGDRARRRSTTSSWTGWSRRRKSLTVAPAEDPGCARRPGDRRRGPRPHREDHRDGQEGGAAGATQADVGALAERGLLRRPARSSRTCRENATHRAGGDLRPGAGGDQGEGPRRRAARSPMARSTR